MFRYSQLLGLFAMTLISLMGSPAIAQQKTLAKIHVNWFLPETVTLIAKGLGYFAAEGVEVQFTRTGSSTQQMRGLGQGTYQIGITAFDNVLAWSGREGAEIIAIVQPNDTIALPLFVRPEIRSFADLKGKKLAVDAVDTAFALALRRILLANGLDLKRGDYELVSVGAPQQRLDSMKKGDTFAAIINVPMDIQASAAGMLPLTYDREAILKGYPGLVFAVSRSWAQSNRAELTAFLRAWRTALRWLKNPANRDEAIRMIISEGQLNPKQAADFYMQVPQDGLINMGGAKMVLDMRNELVKPPIKGPVLDVYVDQSYFQAATPR